MKIARRLVLAFDVRERRRLAALGGAVGVLHLVGWGLIALYAPEHPVLGGLAVLAYSFGLRHAFDADHISAIDNVTRKLAAGGGRPLGVGFFFSLGHSTVVFVLSLGLVVAVGLVHHALPMLQFYGGTIGAGVSGVFLWTIGLLNLAILVGIIRVARGARATGIDEAELENHLANRGFMSRICRGRFRLITRSSQIYPVGVLFGLGFDTASEVGLLAITAGAAAGHVPPLAIIALPCLFAGGMSLMDTADGVFMCKAYDWAFASPARKLYYNITITSLSVCVALLVGTIELAKALASNLGWEGGFWGWLEAIDFGTLGYAIVAMFVLAWVIALAVWRWRRIEDRWAPALPASKP